MIAHSAPTEPQACLPETVVRPTTGWQALAFGELWHYRDLVYFLAWRDVKVRYKQAVLGVAWAILQPACMMLVLMFVMGRLAGLPTGGVPAPVFFLSGLLPWMFFASAVTAAANSVVESERLVTKVYFPRLAIPIAALGAAAVEFALASILLGVLALWYGIRPAPTLLLLPVVVVLLLAAAAGIGAWIAALNVAYRDFRYVVPFMMQIWMFATPSIYMDTDAAARSGAPPEASAAAESPLAASAGSQAAALFEFNPMTSLVSLFRAAVTGGHFRLERLAYSAATVLCVLIAGIAYFRRVEDSFADVI